MMRWRGVIEEYRKFLPVTDETPVVTLGEGNTPLILRSDWPIKSLPASTCI